MPADLMTPNVASSGAPVYRKHGTPRPRIGRRPDLELSRGGWASRGRRILLRGCYNRGVLVDDFLPTYDVSDSVATVVAADAATTWTP
jgi:hypothetical protein